eukprot:tig00021326_g20265.t1
MSPSTSSAATRRGIEGLARRIAAGYDHQVRFVGKIQPHGIFLALERGTLRVAYISANGGRLAGGAGGELEAAGLLGKPARALLAEASWPLVEEALALPPDELRLAAPLRLQAADGSWWHATMFAPREGLVALELEEAGAGEPGRLYAVMREIHAATEAFAAARSEEELCRRAPELLLRIAPGPFHRCILLDFDPDGNGRMRAEAVSAPEHARFADLRFPASDIPAVGRALFRLTRVRMIKDVQAEQSAILGLDELGGEALDLSASLLRAPTACCSEYHSNVGIYGFCLWPIEAAGPDGEPYLWGLLNLHACRPGGQLLELEVRHALLLLVQAFQTSLARIHSDEARATARAAKAALTAMLASAREEAGGADAGGFLRDALPRLATLVPSHGACAVVGGAVHAWGHVPSERVVRAVAARAAAALLRGPGADSAAAPASLQTESLRDLLWEGEGGPPAGAEAAALEADLAAWGGALLVPTSPSGDLLAWFREAEAQSVTWAGALEARSAPLGQLAPLTPCNSFSSWTQILRDRCRAWEARPAPPRPPRPAPLRRGQRGAVMAGESAGAAVGELLQVAERLRSRREIDSLNERLRGSNAGLERAAAELRTLVANAPIPVFAVDPELRVAEWNPACEQVFGVPRASILARPFLEALVPGPYRAAVGEAVRRAMEQQATQEFEVALLRGDAPRPEAAPAPVPLAISTPGPETFYSVPVPAHLLTPPCPAPSASSPRAPVPLRHSAAAAAAAATSRASSAHASPFLRPLPPGPPDAAGAAAGETQLQEAPSPGAPSPSPSASRGGGTPAPAGEQMMEVFVRAAARVDAAGRVTGAVLVCQDLTAQREVTRVQTRLAEAAAANTAKTFFLAALSHEMRTPLNGLLGMLQLAMEAGRAGGEAEREECIAKAMSSGEYLAALIGNVLDLSLIEAGKLVLKAEPFSLPALVRSAIALLASKAAEKRLSVAVALADGLPASFLGDPDRLKQVLVNLVSNAIKYSHRGEILPRGGPGAGRGGGKPAAPRALSVRFEVVDQGVGVRAEDQERLFQLFVRLGSGPSQEDPGGTGLGLVICKNLVEVMGGRIGVASRVGAGSTFWPEDAPAAALARAGPAGREAGAGAGAAEEAGPARVLIVEDNAFNLEVCRKMLTRAGHAVEAVLNGLQAVRLYRERLGLPPPSPPLSGADGPAPPPAPARPRPPRGSAGPPSTSCAAPRAARAARPL